MSVKPGFLTTEFIQSAVFAVVSLLFAFKVLDGSPEDATNLAQTVAAGLATLAGAIPIAFYSMSRAKVKSEAMESEASTEREREFTKRMLSDRSS